MTQLEKYAELIVRTGLNIQDKQTLVISTPIQAADFARVCSIKAYEAGAKEVVMNWFDDASRKIYYEMASDETFDEPVEWSAQFKNHYADIDSAFLSISASDPEMMKGIDPSKFSRVAKANAELIKPYRKKLMSNKCAWCVASVPTEGWAKKVFPHMTAEKAMEALWQAILLSTRANLDNPVAAWKEHQKSLEEKMTILNETQFKYLKYKNSIGTDVTVELPDNHIWFGGSDDHAVKGYKFVANIPTEEIFSLPKATGVNGKIVSSYPLNRNGVLIKDFWFEFKDGLVVDYGAGENLDTLKELLNTDEGSKRLGEVALVPYNSPISNQGILFYNTLFDENASCHFAIGEAYPICIKNGEDMTEEELKNAGANTSITHVDFMVGTKDLEIIGLTKDGKEIQIFREGNFAI